MPDCPNDWLPDCQAAKLPNCQTARLLDCLTKIWCNIIEWPTWCPNPCQRRSSCRACRGSAGRGRRGCPRRWGRWRRTSRRSSAPGCGSRSCRSGPRPSDPPSTSARSSSAGRSQRRPGGQKEDARVESVIPRRATFLCFDYNVWLLKRSSNLSLSIHILRFFIFSPRLFLLVMLSWFGYTALVTFKIRRMCPWPPQLFSSSPLKCQFVIITINCPNKKSI